MTAGTPNSREDRDIFRLAPTADATTIEVIANRLEFRATDDRYVELSQAYFDRLPLDAADRILAVGCGTGVEVRALAGRLRTGVEVVGVDHSQALIEIAQRLAIEGGLADRVHYRVGDAHHLEFGEATFDIVLLHTLMSHVDDPLQVLREARRVTRPGGTIAIFDGDYASLTFAFPDPLRANEIEEMLLKAVVANPRVMRDLPRLAREAGLDLESATGVVYADIGTGSFWVNVAESFGGVLARSGFLPRTEVESWQRYQQRAVAEQTFFGASNFYTFIARTPR